MNKDSGSFTNYDSDSGVSMNSDSARSDYGGESKKIKLRAEDGEWRVAWVHLIQKARSFLKEITRE